MPMDINVGPKVLFFLSFSGPLFLRRELSLRLSQSLCRDFPVFGIGDNLSLRGSQKIRQAQVDSDRERGGRKGLRDDLIARERDKPFAAILAAKSTGFDFSFQSPVNLDGDLSDPREAKNIPDESKTGLGIGEGVIPVLSTEAWKAGLLSCLDSSEERLVGPVDPPGHVLKNLGMDQ